MNVHLQVLVYRISSNRGPGLYSFSRVLFPASIWGWPQIGAGLYLFLYSGNLPYVLIDSAFYRRRVMAASQVVPRGVYEKESVVRGHHIRVCRMRHSFFSSC